VYVCVCVCVCLLNAMADDVAIFRRLLLLASVVHRHHHRSHRRLPVENIFPLFSIYIDRKTIKWENAGEEIFVKIYGVPLFRCVLVDCSRLASLLLMPFGELWKIASEELFNRYESIPIVQFAPLAFPASAIHLCCGKKRTNSNSIAGLLAAKQMKFASSISFHDEDGSLKHGMLRAMKLNDVAMEML